MRNNYLFTILFFFSIASFSQVGIGTTTPEGALDITTTDGGLLVPRVSLTNLSTEAPVLNPQGGSVVESTLIYHDGTNSITAGFYFWNGTVWTPIGGSDADWTISGSDMYNANPGNVGVGTTTPQAAFHLNGTIASGGTTDLINEDFSSYTISQNSSSAGCSPNGWAIVAAGASTYPCTSCAGNRLEINSDVLGCSQDATIVMAFTPTGATVDISFDYRYRHFGGSSMRAYLYNEDTASQVGGDFFNITSDANTSYSNIGVAVTAGTNYSLRFYYFGDYDYGASIDNVLVQENGASSGGYVFRLSDGNEAVGRVLTSDANGNATWQTPSGGSSGTDDQVIDTFSLAGNILSISIEDDGIAPLTVDLSGLAGGGGSYTFENGLTETASTVRLGGSLTQDTTIDLDDEDLTIRTSNTTALFPGDFIIESANGDHVLETNLEEEYIVFGEGGAFVDSDDGQTFTDTGGALYTKDFAAGFDNGGAGGTAIAVGSIEYFVDGTNELFYEGSGFHPMSDETSQFGNTLGSSGYRWGAVYATNGVITTSDMNLKQNVKDITYGLDEVLQLKTISYNWKNNEKLGNTVIPQDQQEKKIGFSAQQLSELIPEVVQTHRWVKTDESGNYKRVKNDYLGVNYSDIIPVTVKAIQEQQEQIEDLKATVEELKKQNEILMQLLEKK
ncbi:MAG: tail fiber domain-containing protein [Flavobacteriaceae bacterium]|nr:tail fiber domain-containing protein [Flavobacteriaceae bacterium]